MLNSNAAIEHSGVEPSFTSGQDRHEVGVCGKLEDEEAETSAGLVLHADELLGVPGGAREAADGLLELLHDVGHALETVVGGVVLTGLGRPGGNGKEGGTLEEKQLLGLDSDAEVGEIPLDRG